MYNPFPRGIYNSVWSWGATSAAWWGPCEPVCRSGRMPRLEGELRRRGYGTRGTIAREPWYPRGNCAAEGHVTSPHATFLSDVDGGAGAVDMGGGQGCEAGRGKAVTMPQVPSVVLPQWRPSTRILGNNACPAATQRARSGLPQSPLKAEATSLLLPRARHNFHCNSWKSRKLRSGPSRVLPHLTPCSPVSLTVSVGDTPW